MAVLPDLKEEQEDPTQGSGERLHLDEKSTLELEIEREGFEKPDHSKIKGSI